MPRQIMRLSKQHKQILLLLLRKNPGPLRLYEIMRSIRTLKWKKWESTEEDKLPRPRVISASICRSLENLREKGLAIKQEGGWRLTTEGLVTSREINRELELQIEKLRHQIEELDEIRDIFP